MTCASAPGRVQGSTGTVRFLLEVAGRDPGFAQILRVAHDGRHHEPVAAARLAEQVVILRTVASRRTARRSCAGSRDESASSPPRAIGPPDARGQAERNAAALRTRPAAAPSARRGQPAAIAAGREWPTAALVHRPADGTGRAGSAGRHRFPTSATGRPARRCARVPARARSPAPRRLCTVRSLSRRGLDPGVSELAAGVVQRECSRSRLEAA